LAVHTIYSFVFHLCELVPGFPVSRFQSPPSYGWSIVTMGLYCIVIEI